MEREDLVARTPASRERYVDFLRAFSIIVVVVGHWLTALIEWRGGVIEVHNVIGITAGLWAATWLLQVMPVFFFVGGFSNFKALASSKRRGKPVTAFLRTRAARLLRPTAVFVALWLPIQAILHLTGRGGTGLLRGGILPFGPVWFLIVYLAVVLLAPLMLELHRRLGIWVPAGLGALAAGADLLAFGAGLEGLRWINLGFVWLLAHQLGFFYADGSLLRVSRAAHLALAGAGLGALVVLTNIGVYPRSMIGTDFEPLSNMNPPTICIVALTLWQVGLAMLLRDRIAAWLERPRPWGATVAANGIIMTLFLWHMTAYALVLLALWPLGLGRWEDSAASWWLQRPLWLLLPAAILGVLIRMFGRFERAPRAPVAA